MVLLNEDLRRDLWNMPYGAGLIDAWRDLERATEHARAWLGRNDRFYLLARLLNRPDIAHPWLYARCREVEQEPDGRLDLWAREHYKSTIITFAGVIQEILRDREITVGIFSHTKPVSKQFLKQIKLEFETNQGLKTTYPDVLWVNPLVDAPVWSIDNGIIVRRQSNPKEPTLSAHGLVDGQPTGFHFRLMVYDDVVTFESVSTPEQIQKTTDAWVLSDNLGARGEDGKARKWHIGTRYKFADTYEEIMARGVIQRIYPATDNGQRDGTPVFLSTEVWEEKKRIQKGPVLAAQMLQNPSAAGQTVFQKEWLRFLDIRPATLNVYIMADPASSRKKNSDRTAMAVVGIDAGGNRYLLDGYCHKMSLSERWEALRGLRMVWTRMPGVQSLTVGYEKYGMQSDIEYFEERMERDKDLWQIHELNWVKEGGNSKTDRVQRLEPYFRAGRFYLPAVMTTETPNQRRVKAEGQSFRIYKPVIRRDENGDLYSLNERFLNEFVPFPFGSKDDLIDATSRIEDEIMGACAPVIIDESSLEPEAA